MPNRRQLENRLRWAAAGAVVVTALLALVGVRVAEGRSTPVPIAEDVAAEGAAGLAAAPVEAPTTTSPPPTTTTLPPATTPVTVRRAPTTVPPTTVPASVPAKAPSPPATSAGKVFLAAPVAASDADRCAAARQWVDAQGLILPPGYGYRCPGPALQGETPRWGITCWNCEGAGSYIAVDIARIGPSDATLRYVVAHETCHAIDFAHTGVSTEIGADLCALLHGAPRP